MSSTASASASQSSPTARRSITAIVAATSNNGIGVNGGLPWRLPGEMKYFARVTTGEQPSEDPELQNAVIMGRKTWESIPPKFRPLRSRRNLVISRAGVDVSSSSNTFTHSSLESALSSLPASSTPRTFLIGGSSLYTTSLTTSPTPLVDRVLLTRIISTQFDEQCDAFLEDFTNHIDEKSGEKRWRRCNLAELREWIGWDVQEENEEKGVKYRYEMWVLASGHSQ
ncbi:hypothetical protein CI109_106120 [Kwoniella shandongensis]|uniref:Dihydrofolate reductase n=1 Tax=Kwoniella shandongensis TaxID=1734106 RepID=A0A5M6C2E1_9TREE|nr:uncharacterized protein CI109_003726 [Kwoniella shandongensis]KAA5527755.1 hypothetical protein CI109_003726 [Kwoniella shandongensis]